MADILDDLKSQQDLDRSQVYDSVIALPQQCLHAWQDTLDFKVPPSYKKVNKIIMTGMGGSGLGARIIESVYADQLAYPLQRLNDYNLPDWADNKTLVICSSFSGTTEETVSNARQAQAKKCRWMSISSGCALHQLALKHRVPAYKINPLYNPSKQPRLAIGYSVIGQLVMVAKVGLINFNKTDVNALVTVMNHILEKNNRQLLTAKNPAKQLALQLYQKEVIFVASRHLTGAGHTVKNQMNENPKNLSHRHDIPELNHHLMEGLKFPQSNRKNLVFLFLQSDLYPHRIQQRFSITQAVVKKNQIEAVSWQALAKNALSEVFEFIQFGALVNYYLSMLYRLDPAPVPWVDYFKTKLGQSLGQWK